MSAHRFSTMTSGTLPASLFLFEPEKDCTLPFLTLCQFSRQTRLISPKRFHSIGLALSVLYQHKNHCSFFRPHSSVTFHLFILTPYALGVTGGPIIEIFKL